MYSRKEHFELFLSEIQGKTNVPNNVVDICKFELLKNGYNVSNENVCSVLKQLDSKKYLESAPYITKKLGGEVLNISKEKELEILKLYDQIHINDIRKLSQNCILYKICDKLGYDEYLNFISISDKLKMFTLNID